MPRDGSGNYTLPVGNPVVTGTLITSAWANATMSDVAVQLNNVLTRDGILGPIGPFKLVDGAVATPGLAFNSEPGLGIFRPAGATISFAAVNGIPATLDASSSTNTVLRLFPRGVGGNSGVTSTNQPSGTANRTDLIVRMTATGSDVGQVPAGTGTLLPQNYAASKHVWTTDNASKTDDFTFSNTGAGGVNIKFIGNGGSPNKFIRIVNGTMEWVNSAYTQVIASLTDTGVFTANNVGIFSDERLKYNIIPAIGARAKLARLAGYLYQLKSEQNEETGENDKWHRGLIAQQVREVYPELVHEDANGILSVNYIGLISELIQAMNEITVNG